MVAERKKLYEEWMAIGEEKESYMIRLFTEPVTLKDKEGFLTLTYSDGQWKAKLAHDYKFGTYGKPSVILDAAGKPCRVEYLFESSETSHSGARA